MFNQERDLFFSQVPKILICKTRVNNICFIETHWLEVNEICVGYEHHHCCYDFMLNLEENEVTLDWFGLRGIPTEGGS